MTPHRSRQGEASSGGTISFLPPIRGKPLNVCGNHQSFGHQGLKSSKINYFFGDLGTLLVKYVKMADLREMLISVIARDNMGKGQVLGAGRSRVVQVPS